MLIPVVEVTFLLFVFSFVLFCSFFFIVLERKLYFLTQRIWEAPMLTFAQDPQKLSSTPGCSRKTQSGVQQRKPVVMQSKECGSRSLIFLPWWMGGPLQWIWSRVALVWCIHSTNHFSLQSQIRLLPRRSL